MNTSITYEPLPKIKRWTGDGFSSTPRVFTLLKRENDVAIYKRTIEVTGSFEGYEVFKVTRHNGYELGGQVVKPAESYPGSTAFGKTAFFVMTRKRAEEKMHELITKQLEKEKEAIENPNRPQRGRPRKTQ